MKKYITVAALLAAGSSAWAGLTTETTTISSGNYAGTYSGKIVKITPSASFDAATFNILESESNGELKWGDNISGSASNIALSGSATEENFWNYFVSNSYNKTTFGHTLYVSAAAQSTQIETRLSPFTIGGLIVEDNSEVPDYTLTLGRAGATLFEINGGKETGFVANIHANTILVGNTGINVLSNATWNIATGKTVTLRSTAGVSLLNGSTMTVSGGNLVVEKFVFSGTEKYTFDGGLEWGSLDRFTLNDGASLTVNNRGFSSDFTGTVTLKNIDGTAGAHKELNLANYGKAGSKIILENMGGVNLWLTGNTVNADIELGSGGLTLSNGSGGSTTTFAGKITGEGDFTHNTNVAQNYKFTGDLSEFKGNFFRTAGGTHKDNPTPGALIFGNGGEGITDGSVSGTGKISWGTGDYTDNKFRIFYNYSNDVYASNEIVKGALVKQGAGSLTLKGKNSSDGGTTVSAGTLIAGSATALGAGAVSVESGANLGLVADVVVTGVSSITLADGAMFLIDLTKYAAATESFSLDLVTGAAITFGSASAASESDEIAGSWFQLKGWEKDGWTSALSYDNSGKTLSLTMTVPEPSAFGMLAGLGALALVASRRRRSR